MLCNNCSDKDLISMSQETTKIAFARSNVLLADFERTTDQALHR